jgi:hypothetical protein
MYLNICKKFKQQLFAIEFTQISLEEKIPETLSYPLNNSHQNNHLKCPLKSWQKIIVGDKT